METSGFHQEPLYGSQVRRRTRFVSIQRVLADIALIAILLSGTLYITEEYAFAQMPLLVFGVVILMGLGLSLRVVRVKLPVLVSLTLLILFMTISSLANSDFGLFFQTVGLLAIGLSTLSVYPNLPGASDVRRIYKLLVMTHAPLIVVPLIYGSTPSIPYRGIFANPNSFGSVLATLFSCEIAILFGMLTQTQARHGGLRTGRLILSLVIISGTVVGIVYSNSRTAFVSIIGVTISVLLCYMPLISKGRITRTDLRGAGLLVAVIAIVSCFVLLIEIRTKILERTIIDKFVSKTSRGDILGGRDAVWLRTLADSRVLGNGSEYFLQLGMGAHSTFISILGQYGWIPFLLWVVFLLIGMTYTIRYALQYRYLNSYAAMPLANCMSFFLMSMAEGMLLKVSMFLALFGIGLTSHAARARISSHHLMPRQRLLHTHSVCYPRSLSE